MRLERAERDPSQAPGDRLRYVRRGPRGDHRHVGFRRGRHQNRAAGGRSVAAVVGDARHREVRGQLLVAAHVTQQAELGAGSHSPRWPRGSGSPGEDRGRLRHQLPGVAACEVPPRLRGPERREPAPGLRARDRLRRGR